MNRNLKVCISSENGRQADIEFCFKREKCGEYPYYITGNGFFNDLVEGGADYDAAIHLEHAVDKYVKEALAEFRKKYEVPAEIITTLRKTEVTMHSKTPRPTRIISGDITVGEEPISRIELISAPRTYDTYAGTALQYITREEFDRKEEEGELIEGQVYMVLC